MACGGCNSNRKYTNKVNSTSKDLFGNYKYLSNRQIEARLAKYKKNNCPDCDDRYVCNYPHFLACKKGE
jgi:hypothetical protein